MRNNPYRMPFYRLLPFIFSVFFIGTASAQRYEVGLQGGMTNLVGDIGRTSFVLQKPFRSLSDFGLPAYGGLIFRMNFNPYQTVRLNLGFSNVQFADAAAKETYRRQRKYSGTNSVYNADLQFEYNFLPVNNEQKGMLSPYIFGGIGAIAFNNRRLDVDTDTGYSRTTYFNDLKASIPFGAGLKYKFSYNWAIFGEFKFRYTTTDNIDYSKLSVKNVRLGTFDGDKFTPIKGKNLTPEQIELRNTVAADNQIGNTESKDWINAVTIGLSYSFGRPPCYCSQ